MLCYDFEMEHKEKSRTKQVHRLLVAGQAPQVGTHWATGDMMIEGKRATEGVV